MRFFTLILIGILTPVFAQAQNPIAIDEPDFVDFSFLTPKEKIDKVPDKKTPEPDSKKPKTTPEKKIVPTPKPPKEKVNITVKFLAGPYKGNKVTIDEHSPWRVQFSGNVNSGKKLNVYITRNPKQKGLLINSQNLSTDLINTSSKWDFMWRGSLATGKMPSKMVRYYMYAEVVNEKNQVMARSFWRVGKKLGVMTIK